MAHGVHPFRHNSHLCGQKAQKDTKIHIVGFKVIQGYQC